MGKKEKEEEEEGETQSPQNFLYIEVRTQWLEQQLGQS